MKSKRTLDNKIIILEGPDCSGKDTVAEELVKHFEFKGKKALHVRHTGHTEFGNIVRELLIGGKLTPITSTAMILTAQATVASDIANSEDDYDYFIINRWILSTILYQGLLEAPREVLENTAATYDMLSRRVMDVHDLYCSISNISKVRALSGTYFILLPPKEVIKERMIKRGNKDWLEEDEFLQNLLHDQYSKVPSKNWDYALRASSISIVESSEDIIKLIEGEV